MRSDCMGMTRIGAQVVKVRKAGLKEAGETSVAEIEGRGIVPVETNFDPQTVINTSLHS